MPSTTKRKSTIKNPNSKHRLIAIKLRSKPGTWFKVGGYKNRNSAYTVVSQIRHSTGNLGGKGKSYAGGHYSAMIRGEAQVWARYDG